MAYKMYASYGYDGYLYPLVHHGVVEAVDNINKADAILFGGGEDISPSMYDQKPGSRTWSNSNRCKAEIMDFRYGRDKGLPMIGVCRCMQLLTAAHGGHLIQHVNNNATGRRHIMYFPKKKKDVFLQVNSLHHQMCVPDPEAVLVGYADHLATVTLGEYDKEVVAPLQEPEALYWPETNSFGVQWHPEMMGVNDPAVLWYVEQVKQVLKGEYHV